MMRLSMLLESTPWLAAVTPRPLVMTLLFAAVLALTASVYFLRRLGAAWPMRCWPSTQGRVLLAEMRRGKTKTADGCLLFDPVLKYSYTVGSQTFEGVRFTHPAASNAATMAAQFITSLGAKTEVLVYYHPSNPADAVVQPLVWQASAVGAFASLVVFFALAAAACLA